MREAQGYTPTIIYVPAGEELAKHSVVSMAEGGTVQRVQTSGLAAVGIALSDSPSGGFVPVQTDGVVYEWEGHPEELIPGKIYFQGTDGALTGTPISETHFQVGVAVGKTTFQIRLGGVSGGSGGNVANVTITEYFRVSQEAIELQALYLPNPVKSPDFIEDIILAGGDIHLKPGIDYFLEEAGADPEAPYNRITWKPSLLNPGEESILKRLKIRDLLTIKRKEYAATLPGSGGPGSLQIIVDGGEI